MATIIDALLITLGLDDRQYQEGVRRYETTRTKQEKAEETARKKESEGRKRQVNDLQAVAKSALAMFAVFTAGQALKDFVTSTIAGDAATGRLARNLGIATDQLSIYEGVTERAGGTAQDAAASLQSLANIYEEIKLTGTTSKTGILQALGITSLDQLNDIPGALERIHAKLLKLSPKDQQAFGAQIGFAPSFTNALASPTWHGDLASQKSIGFLSQDQAERFQRAQKALVEMGQAARQVGRDILADAAPALTLMAKVLSKLAIWLQDHRGLVVGALIGVGAAFTIAGAAIAAATVEFWGPIAAITAIGAAIGGLIGWLLKFKAVQDVIHAVTGLWDHLTGQKTIPPVPGEPVEGVGGRDLGRGRRAGPLYGGGVEKPGWGPGTPTSPSFSRALEGNLIDKFFRDSGFNPVTANAITSGLYSESGLDPNNVNRSSGAYGLAQWLGKRKKALFAQFGSHPNLAQQLQFIMQELKGTGIGAEMQAKGAHGDFAGALQLFLHKFEAPGAAGEMADARRAYNFARHGAARAQKGSGAHTTNIAKIDVHTQATDAHGVARGLRGAIARYQYIGQANSGLA